MILLKASLCFQLHSPLHSIGDLYDATGLPCSFRIFNELSTGVRRRFLCRCPIEPVATEKGKSFFPIAFAENGRERRLSEKIAQTQGKDKPTRSSVNRTMRFGSTRNALSGEIMTCKHSRRTTSINQNAGFGVRSGHGKRFGGSPSICTHSDVQTFEKRSEPSGLSLRLTERVLTL